jgi:Transposase DDE domain group 1
MNLIEARDPLPAVGNGWSVVLVERILRQTQVLEVLPQWSQLQLGHASGRVTAYRPGQRLTAVVATLAAGLKGLGPANTYLRPNSAVRAWLGGRFPDQGTIHRWLQQTTDPQAAAVRNHLHQVVRQHGRFWNELWSNRWLVLDVDGQGLVARGQRFEKAAKGWLGEGIDRGYLRYVCYAGASHEVLDEFLAAGNQTLMSQFPVLLAGLDEVIPRAYRNRVVLRGDSHMGTIGNLRDCRSHGYHYLCPLQSWSAEKRLREYVQQRGRRGGWFTEVDSKGQAHRVQYWIVKRWQLSGKGKSRKLSTHATVYCEHLPTGKKEWSVLVSDLKREKGRRLWQDYRQRGGTIEEYNDQAERAYHLEIMRTSSFAGLNALHSLIGLCWNLTRWAAEQLALPPLQAPQAERARWQPAAAMDLSAVVARAAHSGLRLYRAQAGATLEVEDTAGTPESRAWRCWLQEPIQLLLPLTG